MKLFRHQKGFTLIELLVVIGIIAVIAMLGVGNLVTSQRRARNTKRIADLKSIGQALEQAYSPTTGYDIDLSNGITDGSTAVMANVPTDPSGTTYQMSNPASPNQTAAYCITTQGAFEEPRDNVNCTGCPATCTGTDCSFNTGTNDRFCVTNQQ